MADKPFTLISDYALHRIFTESPRGRYGVQFLVPTVLHGKVGGFSALRSGCARIYFPGLFIGGSSY
jgi:hypothetical protein